LSFILTYAIRLQQLEVKRMPVETIEQRHRESAAKALESRYPHDKRTAPVAARIRAGEADDNAAVQGAAFYEADSSDPELELRLNVKKSCLNLGEGQA
jgi:hypothetical protein